jgi:hypothetical protein
MKGSNLDQILEMIKVFASGKLSLSVFNWQAFSTSSQPQLISKLLERATLWKVLAWITYKR